MRVHANPRASMPRVASRRRRSRATAFAARAARSNEDRQPEAFADGKRPIQLPGADVPPRRAHMAPAVAAPQWKMVRQGI